MLLATTLLADGQPLQINNILGKHVLSERVTLEIYANTKGELWCSIAVDGKERGGSTIAKNTGEETTFFWDDPTSTLWIVTPATISKSDYSKKDSSNSSSQNIASAATMNPPEQVTEFLKSFNKLKQ
ncbi:MAG TPA: hypothetical protein VIT23_07795 [Terrimicrobiaceae bacterium]